MSETVTDDMVAKARAAYSKATGNDDTPHHLDGWIEDALRASLEAVLIDTPAPSPLVMGREPDAWRYRHVPTVAWSYSDTKHPRDDLIQEPLYVSATAEIDRLKNENERMRVALKPFADCADELDYDDKDRERETPDEEWAKFRLLAGDYRRARAALKSEGE